MTLCSNKPVDERLPTMDDIEVLKRLFIVFGSLYPIMNAKVLNFY